MLSKRCPWASFSFLGIGKNHRGWGPVSREGGAWLSCSWKPKTAAKQAMHELEHCHDAGPRCCCTTCLKKFALDVFPQSPWKVTIHHLSWWNKFLMQDAFNGTPPPSPTKKKALNLSCFLWLPWSWNLPLRWLFLHLRVVPKYPRFITSNEVGIVFSLFLEFSADSNAVFILIITHVHTNIHTYHFGGPQILSYNSRTWNLSEKTHNTLHISLEQILL